MTVLQKPAAPPGHDLFRAFLSANNIGPREAAKALNVTHVAIIAWRDGKTVPSEPARVAIERWTGGRVKAVDWASDEERTKYAGVVPFEKSTGTDGNS